MKKFVEEEIYVKNYKVNLPLSLTEDEKKELSLYIDFNNTFYNLAKKYCNDNFEKIKKESNFDKLFDKYMKSNGEERSLIRKKIVDIFFKFKITRNDLTEYLLDHIFYSENDLKFVENLNVKNVAKYTIDAFYEGVFKSAKLDIFNKNMLKKGTYIEFKNFLKKKDLKDIKDETELKYETRLNCDKELFFMNENLSYKIDFSNKKEYKYIIKDSVVKNILVARTDNGIELMVFASIMNFPKLDFDYDLPRYHSKKTTKKKII